LRLASKRLKKVEEQLLETHTDAAGWKRRHEDTAQRAAERKAAAELSRKRAEGAEADAAEWKERGRALSVEARELEQEPASRAES
jgi:hypothetical protein